MAKEEDESEGINTNRSCTDIVFLILFILFIGGMGYGSYRGFANGNPYRLLYGVDSWGNVCGKENDPIANVSISGKDMSDKPYSFHFNPMKFSSMMPGNPLNAIFKVETPVICIESCPNKTVTSFESYREDSGVWLCRYNESASFDKQICPTLPVTEHVDLLNRCVPKAVLNMASTITSSVTSMFSSFSIGGETAEKIASDIKETWQEISYLSAMSVGFSLFLVIALRFLAGILIWFLVLLIAAFVIAANAYCWFIWFSKNTDLYSVPAAYRFESDIANEKTWLIYACVASGVMVLVLLILLAVRKRIGLVVQLFREAGRALKACPFLILQPFWTLLFLIIAIAGLLFISLFIESSGLPEVDPKTGYVTFEFDKIMTYLRWYHYFGILWITAFIGACQENVIAGAIAKWFFTRDKSEVGWPVLSSMRRLIRYHLGTVAFGSFIIAAVRMVRLILAYIQSRLQGRASKIAEYLLKVLACFLWCFEKLLKFINRNAYIEVAIHGCSFCRGARKAFTLIINNALRVAAINSVGDFILFLGKLGTVGVVLVVGNELLKPKDLNFIWAPLTIAALIAFAIAHCFMSVYEMTIDTIFVCFCEDMEMNDGSSKPYYMSAGLLAFMNSGEKKQKKTVKIKVKSKEEKSKAKGRKAKQDDSFV